MKKIDYTKYIEDTYYKFIDAKNHGNGNNWWYPTQNTIAYNVKMHSFASTNKIREVLTQVQNEYYNDEELYQYMQDEEESACRFLKEEIQQLSNNLTDVYFAGRSGGWIEVTYINNIDIDIIEPRYNYTVKEIKEVYKVAKELNTLEEKVKAFIEEQHKHYNKYIDTSEYYSDIAMSLLDDNDIKQLYKEKGEYFTKLATTN